jgi:hypothetical protein
MKLHYLVKHTNLMLSLKSLKIDADAGDIVGFNHFADRKASKIPTTKNSKNNLLYVTAPVNKKHIAAGLLLRSRTTISRMLTVSVCI